MRVPPDFEIEDRERHGLVVGYPENRKVRNPSEPAADKDRVRKCRIVVPGKNHDREIGFGEQPSRAIEYDRAQLIILEGVPRQQNDIRPYRACGHLHRAQPRRPVAATAILVDMQIRAVDEDDFADHCRSIASVPTGAQPGLAPSLVRPVFRKINTVNQRNDGLVTRKQCADPGAVLAVFAGNLQRGTSSPLQKSWGAGGAANKKNSAGVRLLGLLLIVRCANMFGRTTCPGRRSINEGEWYRARYDYYMSSQIFQTINANISQPYRGQRRRDLG